MERWKNRVALVTGASVGIGAAICQELVKHGMIVVGCARRETAVKKISEELKHLPGKLHPYRCDVSKDEEVLGLFDWIKQTLGGVDVCVNNAGMTFGGSLLDGSPTEWRYMLDVNVVSLCLCTREAVRSMRERNVDDGHIIHINSISGHGVYGSHFYAATKHAVTALTEGYRRELRDIKSHIRVSSISPGRVVTEFAHEMFKKEPQKEKARYEEFQCMVPQDIAQIVTNVLSAPPHVQVHDIIVRPTEDAM